MYTHGPERELARYQGAARTPQYLRRTQAPKSRVRLGIVRVVPGLAQQGRGWLAYLLPIILDPSRLYFVVPDADVGVSRYPATQRILLLTVPGPSRALRGPRLDVEVSRYLATQRVLLLTVSGPSRALRGPRLDVEVPRYSATQRIMLLIMVDPSRARWLRGCRNGSMRRSGVMLLIMVEPSRF